MTEEMTETKVHSPTTIVSTQNKFDKKQTVNFAMTGKTEKVVNSAQT